MTLRRTPMSSRYENRSRGIGREAREVREVFGPYMRIKSRMLMPNNLDRGADDFPNLPASRSFGSAASLPCPMDRITPQNIEALTPRQLGVLLLRGATTGTRGSADLLLR
jgi:hypothetical protein